MFIYKCIQYIIIPLGCGNFIVTVVMVDVGLAVGVKVMPLVMGVVDVHINAYSIS